MTEMVVHFEVPFVPGGPLTPPPCKKLAPPQVLHPCLTGSQCGEFFDPTMPPRGACLCAPRLWSQLSHRSVPKRPGATQREAAFHPEVPHG